MDETLSDFIDQETDEQNETGPSLKLYTAGGGDVAWAYVVEDADSEKRKKKKRETYSGHPNDGFTPELKAVAEGTEFLNNEYPNAEVTIFASNESVIRMVKGEGDPDPDYYGLYRSANNNYHNNRRRWSIKHLPKEKDNPARDII